MAIIRPMPDLAGLESIIIQSERPAILVKDGTFYLDDTHFPWTSALETHRVTLKRSISAVGRLETDDEALPFAAPHSSSNQDWR